MQIQVIRSLAEFETLSSEWNILLKESASHVPFLRHEYLYTWWLSLGGGEWKKGELYIVTGRGEDGALIGIAPFFLTHNREGVPVVMLLGSVEISDFLDIIVHPAAQQIFIDLLFDQLASLPQSDWQAIDLYNILESSPTLNALNQAAAKKGWIYTEDCLQHSPFIPLPGDWETYLAGIDKKQRHEIRRKMRKAEESEESIRWYIANDEQTIDDEISAFLELMAMDAEKQKFLTDDMRSQMRSAVKAAFRGKWLQLAFLEVNGEKAAGYLNFDYDDQVWVYNSGMDFQFSQYSPGWVLLGYLLKWANDNQRKAFDFMRGNEEYKYRFGGIDRFVMRAKIERQ